MTGTGVDRDTTVVSLQIRMGDPGSESFAELLNQLSRVESLLIIGVFLVEQERVRPTDIAQYESVLRNAEYLYARGFRLGHLRHSSPTDILLWAGSLSGGIGVLTVAANRVLAVWNNLQKARVAKSNTDLVIAANDRFMAELEATRGRPLTDDDLPPALHRRMSDASRAIAQAEDITVEE